MRNCGWVMLGTCVRAQTRAGGRFVASVKMVWNEVPPFGKHFISVFVFYFVLYLAFAFYFGFSASSPVRDWRWPRARQHPRLQKDDHRKTSKSQKLHSVAAPAQRPLTQPKLKPKQNER